MALWLDLMRHGAADPDHPSGDAARGLTAAGREDVRRLGAYLASTGWRPDHAFTSPFKRARETAMEILAAAGHALPVESLEELRSEAQPREVIEALETRGLDAGHVLLVTHAPLVGWLTRELTGKEIAFAPGALARVELPDGTRGPGSIVDV